MTHAHVEGIAGGIAVALAAAWAVRAEGTLFDFVLRHLTEESSTRYGIERAATMGELAPWEAARELGNGSQVTSAETQSGPRLGFDPLSSAPASHSGSANPSP